MNWEAQWEQGALLLFKRLPKVEWCLASGWEEIVSNAIVPSFPAVKVFSSRQATKTKSKGASRCTWHWCFDCCRDGFGQDMSCFRTRCKWVWASDAKLEHRIYGDKLNLQFFFLFFFFFEAMSTEAMKMTFNSLARSQFTTGLTIMILCYQQWMIV